MIDNMHKMFISTSRLSKTNTKRGWIQRSILNYIEKYLIFDIIVTSHDDVWLQQDAFMFLKGVTFSALLVLCAGNSSVTGEFPSQRPATRSFDVFSDLCLNNRLSKQP